MNSNAATSSAVADTTTPRTTADLRCLVFGAGSGIGRATVDHLRPRVRAVIGADLPGPRPPGNHNGSPLLQADVTDPGSVENAVEHAVRIAGGIDVVINTAGILGRNRAPGQESIAEFTRLVTTNLVGAYIVSHAVLPRLVENGYGRLVHFSSTAGKEGVAGLTGYSASKAGLIGMIKALAKDYATTGVTVNAIAPGKLDTPMVAAQPPTDADLQRIPMRRLGTVQEAAALIEYVISPAASYTTGFVYDLSGGRASY